MIKRNNTWTILLISLFVVSCKQVKKDQSLDKVNTQNQDEKKYKKVISDSTNKLTGIVETLEVEYTVWGCACPNWIRTIDNENNDTTKQYLSLHFYIEPADKLLELPKNFDALKQKLKLTGQFYQKEDYPQGTIEMEEPMSKAKVFRYTEMELLPN